MIKFYEKGFEIFGQFIAWYGVMITIGIITAFIIATWIFRKIRYKEDIPFEMMLAIIPIGIICSRLWFVIVEAVPIADIFAFKKGGLTIHGAILGGALGLWVYTKFIRKGSFFALSDVLVVVLILAQSIGRWGNFFNVELYGFEVSAHIPPFTVDVYGTPHLALFFIESMLNLVGFFMLLNIFSRQKKLGTTTASYLIYYGIVRAILEPMRMEAYIMRIGFLPVSVLLSIVAIGVGITFLILNKYDKIPQNDDNFLAKEEDSDASKEKESAGHEESIMPSKQISKKAVDHAQIDKEQKEVENKTAAGAEVSMDAESTNAEDEKAHEEETAEKTAKPKSTSAAKKPSTTATKKPTSSSGASEAKKPSASTAKSSSTSSTKKPSAATAKKATPKG